MFRYVALIWKAQPARAEGLAEDLVLRIQALSPSWVVVIRTPGMVVLAADCSHHLSARVLFGGCGVILGEIFPRLDEPGMHQSADGETVSGPVSGVEFDASRTRAVIDSHGRALSTNYWGNFVALAMEPSNGARWIFKDPCGSLPCYFTEIEGLQLVFSCLGDLHELGLRLRVNWAFLREKVVSGPREVSEPSFLGVSRVHRGECVRFNRDAVIESRDSYWRLSFEGENALAEPAVAQRAMYSTVLSCVHSLAAQHQSLLMQISGGLDSSIVLGCLGGMHRSRPEIYCYTLFVPDSVCDERRWARYAVQRGGFRQVELPLAPERMNYRALPALAASVEPGSYFLQWQKSPIERDLGARHGATAVFTGDGGDSAFCSTSYVFAVDHCLRRHGLGLRTLRTAARVAMRRDRTVWNVLGKALSRKVLGSGARDGARSLAPFRRLVSSDVRDAWPSGVTMEAMLRLGPLALTPSFYNLSASHHAKVPEVISPLCAQPVAELCARIPVDVHFDGGRIRGLARRAFAYELPEPILRRQWKDRPLTQLGQVIQLNLPFIREHLLEGQLVKERILDRAAVEMALQEGPSTSSAVGSELLSHLELELWIRDSA